MANTYNGVQTTALLLAGVLGLTGGLAAFADDQTFSGNASWYGVPFHGKKTASGEIFDMNKLSGAHKTLPLMSKVLVENPKNGKSTVVKVNDRGPYVKTRVMDLSRKGADSLGYLSHGTAHLDFTVVGKNSALGAPAKKSDDDASKKDSESATKDSDTSKKDSDASRKDSDSSRKDSDSPKKDSAKRDSSLSKKD
jgi:rare lipoprotein A